MNKQKNKFFNKILNLSKSTEGALSLFDIIFISILLIITIFGMVFSFSLNRVFNNVKVEQTPKISINNALEAHILDVGQAECILVKLPENKLLVYDTGLEENGKFILNYIKNNLNKTVIDYLILSHTDLDHIGGAICLIDNLEVKNIVRPIVKSVNSTFDETNLVANYNFSALDDETYANTLKKIYEETEFVYEADYKNVENLNNLFDGDSYNIEFYIPHYYTSSNMNDFSSVITITYMGKTLMITGDATERTEKNLLNNYSVPNVDFLIVAHHGSSTSSSFEFLEKIRPEYAYISVDKNNTYGHPSQETLNKLIYLNVKETRIYSTAKLGTVVLAFNGKNIENTFNAFSIKTGYIIVGLWIVVIVLYIPKFKKIKKLIIVKIRRNRAK